MNIVMSEMKSGSIYYTILILNTFQIIFLLLTPFVLSLDGLTNYSNEDGNERSETLDNEGNVRGQYSYNDPHGKRIKVKYTAGKKGFQVKPIQHIFFFFKYN